MLPGELSLLHTLGPVAVHPDARQAVVGVQRPDLELDAYVGGLWTVPLSGVGTPRRLTHGRRDTDPVFSPDGRWLALLRAEPKARPQLFVLPTDGGDPVRLTDAPLGVSSPAWSPDSRRLALCARIPEDGRYGTGKDAAGDKLDTDAEPPRLITTNAYRQDGLGFIRDRRSHLLVVDLPADDAAAGAVAPATQITTGDADDTSPVWSPDGSLIAFTAGRHAGADDDLRTGLWVCAPDGGGLREVFPTGLSVDELAFAPDGATLWFLASDPGPSGLDFVGRQVGLWSVPVAGGQPTLHSDLTVDELAGPLTVTAGGVRCHRLSRGAVELVRLTPTGLVVEVGGPRQVQSHAVARDGSVVLTFTDPHTAGEVATAAGGAVTDFGAALRATGRLVAPRELTATAPDGYPVHGWVMTPPGSGPHPVLLFVHGGPHAQYGWNLFDEFLVATTAGYAVVFGNPRGSAGYGEAHGRSIRQAMGTVDADDVVALLEAALAGDASLDSSRLGVMGGSYGGYLTGLLTTRTTRFAAAIVERGFLDPVSFAGSSDIGWFFGHEYVGGDPATVAAQSPMAAIDTVTTPTLVIHSEQDWRCPVEQGQRWYAALKRRGVPTELLLFPGEGHELTRSGRPKHRLARFEHVQRWWSTHLPV